MKQFALFLILIGIAGFSVGFLETMSVDVPYYAQFKQTAIGHYIEPIHLIGGGLGAGIMGFILTVARG